MCEIDGIVGIESGVWVPGSPWMSTSSASGSSNMEVRSSFGERSFRGTPSALSHSSDSGGGCGERELERLLWRGAW